MESLAKDVLQRVAEGSTRKKAIIGHIGQATNLSWLLRSTLVLCLLGCIAGLICCRSPSQQRSDLAHRLEGRIYIPTSSHILTGCKAAFEACISRASKSCHRRPDAQFRSRYLFRLPSLKSVPVNGGPNGAGTQSSEEMSRGYKDG